MEQAEAALETACAGVAPAAEGGEGASEVMAARDAAAGVKLAPSDARATPKKAKRYAQLDDEV